MSRYWPVTRVTGHGPWPVPPQPNSLLLYPHYYLDAVRAAASCRPFMRYHCNIIIMGNDLKGDVVRTAAPAGRCELRGNRSGLSSAEGGGAPWTRMHQVHSVRCKRPSWGVRPLAQAGPGAAFADFPSKRPCFVLNDEST